MSGKMVGKKGAARENVAAKANPKKESKNAALRGVFFDPGVERTLEKYNVRNKRFAIKERSVNSNSGGNSSGDKNGHQVTHEVQASKDGFQGI